MEKKLACFWISSLCVNRWLANSLQLGYYSIVGGRGDMESSSILELHACSETSVIETVGVVNIWENPAEEGWQQLISWEVSGNRCMWSSRKMRNPSQDSVSSSSSLPLLVIDARRVVLLSVIYYRHDIWFSLFWGFLPRRRKHTVCYTTTFTHSLSA